MPFGEEIGAGVGGRTTAQGYSQFDGVRQGFTGYENDGETGLNYAQARYYSRSQGRFTSIDPVFLSKQHTVNPQRWNAYTFVLNCPTSLIDPDGRNGQGEGGGKVIDVFLTFKGHERGTVNGKRNKGEDWGGLKREARERGITVNVHYRTSGGTAGDKETSIANMKESLTSEGRIVIIAGHSAAEGLGKKGEFAGTALEASDGHITKYGIRYADPTRGSEVLPTFKAEAIIAATCSITGAVSDFTYHMSPGSTLVYNDGGPDGLTALDTLESGAFAAAQTIVRGGDVQKAAGALQTVINNQQGVNACHNGQCEPRNVGDRIHTTRRE